MGAFAVCMLPYVYVFSQAQALHNSLSLLQGRPLNDGSYGPNESSHNPMASQDVIESWVGVLGTEKFLKLV
jgi:hypothetical protein